MHTNVNGKYHLRDGQNIYFDIDVVYERKDVLRKATGNFIPSVLTTANETLYRQEETRAKTITGYSACPFGECHARNLDEDFVGRLFCGDV